MADVHISADWTQFPLRHPTTFTLILLECSPIDLLSCRATCPTWYSWFSSSSTIWSKYYSSLTNRLAPSDYRLAKLLEVPVAGEADAMSLSVKVHRALKENESVINQETIRIMKDMEKWFLSPVLAHIPVFIRLKVNHPAVEKIVEEFFGRRQLNSFLVVNSAVKAIEENHDIESNFESIYAVKDTVNPEFPTVLELLSIDRPLVEKLLVNRCKIDKHLIVPQLDEFVHHPGLLSSDKLLVGCDSDGKVAVRPETVSQDKDEGPFRYRGFRKHNKVEFWGGRDIRTRWPEFAKQLEKIVLPDMIPTPPTPEDDEHQI